MSALARELETLLDNAQNEQVDLTGLSDLVPDELADNWQQTLEHLSIITQSWRSISKASNALTHRPAQPADGAAGR